MVTDENMPLTAPDALGVPSPDDFAEEGDVQHQLQPHQPPPP
jgi:hypothetical protein